MKLSRKTVGLLNSSTKFDLANTKVQGSQNSDFEKI